MFVSGLNQALQAGSRACYWTWKPRKPVQVRKYVRTFSGRNINPRKLEAMLDRKFDLNYSLQMRSNKFRVFTPEELTDADIASCWGSLDDY